jgi:ABC-type dipeptide/oligopeptide/nickel transport system ATPase component
LVERIRRRGIGLILIVHNLGIVARYADRVIIVHARLAALIIEPPLLLSTIVEAGPLFLPR